MQKSIAESLGKNEHLAIFVYQKIPDPISHFTFLILDIKIYSRSRVSNYPLKKVRNENWGMALLWDFDSFSGIQNLIFLLSGSAICS